MRQVQLKLGLNATLAKLMWNLLIIIVSYRIYRLYEYITCNWQIIID